MYKLNFLFPLIFGICLLSKANAQDYWQQKVDYEINVKLNDKDHTLSAFETFVYHNNSPETLDFIYIHLWPNAYRNHKTALGKQNYASGNDQLKFGNDSIKGGIDSLDFKVNGVSANLEFDVENPDIAKLYLPNSLKSGESITVSTPFKVKLPSGEISRMGHVGESYQITQWYPKPAVYDKNGWNQMPYLNQGEFYSEYGTFRVSITLPKNYVVGATGDLQTQSEIDWLTEKAEDTKTNFKKFTEKANRKNDFPKSSDEWKTLVYIQKDVHDFAWFADKRWGVLKGEVELPHSKRKVTTWTMFTPKNALTWENSIEYVNDGTYYYSLWNGDYPYNQVTAVDGTISAGGGMEYPNVTVIGNSSSKMDLEVVIVHEVGHNWFYGILGSNERVHGWMDEGMNTLNELRYMETKYPDNEQLTNMIRGEMFHMEGLSHFDMSNFAFVLTQKIGEDQAIETHSADFTQANYGTIMYMKTGLVFHYLKEYLGEELFNKCSKAYFEAWKFKHPQPEDMKALFEKESGKNLDWLFKDLINTTNTLDAKLCKVKTDDHCTDIWVKNVGQINGPIEVSGYQNGQLVQKQWVEPSAKKTHLHWDKVMDEVLINSSGKMPELGLNNNYWHKKGLFGKIEPVKITGLTSANNPKESNIAWLPIMGVNTSDKFMLGAAFHNTSIPFNNFQYILAPMYSFGRKNISGFAEFSYLFHPKKAFKVSKFGLSTRSFKQDDIYRGNDDYYLAFKPYWYANLGNRGKAKNYTQTLSISGLYRLDVFGPGQSEHVGGIGTYEYAYKVTDHRFIGKLRSDYLSNAVTGVNATRANAELKYSYRYMQNKKERWLEIRAFHGITEGNLFNPIGAGGFSGETDYFVEDYFFDRAGSSNWLSHQRMENGGNLYIGNSFFGFGASSLTSFSLHTQLPVLPKFIQFFAQYGMANYDSGNSENGINIGLSLKLASVFAVHFPLYQSTDIKNSYFNNNYGEKIQFSLKMDLTGKPFNLSSLNLF